MLISRKEEQKILKEACEANDSQFIAVYGRRRVGKTYLVRETFNNTFTFQHSGLAAGNIKQQLGAFAESLENSGITGFKMPTNWMEAFRILKDLILHSKDKKKIIFIDELSWMDTKRSDLMSALESFWNSFASARKDVLLIVCASATSWMIDHIVHNRGGLHNRLTDRIHLRPFTLLECNEYAGYLGLKMEKDQILEAYMILGGVPYYWSLMKKNLSLAQNIDRLMFGENAYLREEFYYLFASLFNRPESYIKIIEALSGKKSGMSRSELSEKTGLHASGNLTKILKELEYCGFIREYAPFGSRKKGAIYQLIDNFSLFYYKFMDVNKRDPALWSHMSNSTQKNAWAGLAFERVCLLHMDQIKKALGISGVRTEVCSWQCKEDEDRGVEGSQIDLLIVRADRVINLCEMKYSQKEYAISKSDKNDLLRKLNDFRTLTKTKMTVHLTMISFSGIKQNTNFDTVQSVVTGEDLFL